MELFYKSTRDDSVRVTASKAILKGLADDGGLFVPESIPALDKSLEELSKMSYGEVAYEVMKLFFTDFTEEELKKCIANAYDSKSIQQRLHLLSRLMEHISLSCSMVLLSHLRIWHSQFFLTL